LLTSLTLAGPAVAQISPVRTERASADVEFTLTQLTGAWVPQAGAAVALRLAPWVEVAGAGRIGLDHSVVEDQGSQLSVRFGYGGVRVIVEPLPLRARGLALHVLVGAGNVDIRGPNVDGVVDSENGVVLEPGVRFTSAALGALELGASLAWRSAFGFDVVGGIDDGMLTGPALTLGATLLTF